MQQYKSVWIGLRP